VTLPREAGIESALGRNVPLRRGKRLISRADQLSMAGYAGNT
jgi:hypothetical protein